MTPRQEKTPEHRPGRHIDRMVEAQHQLHPDDPTGGGEKRGRPPEDLPREIAALRGALEHEKEKRRKARAELERLRDIVESVRDELDDALGGYASNGADR